MKFIIDMNLAPGWADALRTGGHEAAHWRDVGDWRAPDKAILAYAREHGAIVLTQDLDFGDILAATDADSPSVVLLRADNLSVQAGAPKVLAAVAAHEPTLLAGALISIDTQRARLRWLPIRPAQA